MHPPSPFRSLPPSTPQSHFPSSSPTIRSSSPSNSPDQLRFENDRWSQWWLRMLSTMTKVIPFPPTFPQTSEDQRSLLEDLCSRLCDRASAPHNSPQFETLSAKISRTKSKLTQLRERNQRLSEQLLTEQQISEERLKTAQERLSLIPQIEEVPQPPPAPPPPPPSPSPPMSYTVEIIRESPPPPPPPKPRRPPKDYTVEIIRESPPPPPPPPVPRRPPKNYTIEVVQPPVPRRPPKTYKVELVQPPVRKPRQDSSELAEDLRIVADAVSEAFAQRERERQGIRRGFSVHRRRAPLKKSRGSQFGKR